MKTKSKNRFFAVFLALAMMLTLVPMEMFFIGTTAKAAENAADDGIYVFESKNLTKFAQGDKADGDTEKAGTDNYFTLHYSAKTKIDGGDKTFEDDYVASPRVNFGGKADTSTPKNVISFTTDGAAKVKVWWVSGGNGRQVSIFDSTGASVEDCTTNVDLEANATCISEFTLKEAGKYFLGSTVNNNYFFKVQVTVSQPKEYVFESKNLTKFAQGDKADGDTEKAGTDNYFTLHYSAKTKIDGGDKTFEDGYVASPRVNFGGKADTSTPKNVISFTTGGTAKVKVWWVSGGNGRQVSIFDSTGASVENCTTNVDLEANATCISEFTLNEAGKYFLGSTVNNNYFFKVQVTDGASAGPVERGDWSAVAAPVIGTITQDGGKIVVPVTADVGNDGGDKVVITMTDSEGNETSLQSLATATSHSREFTPTASGKYTFKAVLSREGETDKESTTSEFDFTLPLSKPIISSATSMGGGKIALVWSTVPEATGYVIYKGEEKIGTSETTEFTAEGLDVGSKYSFTVAATRGEEEGEKSAAAEATATAEAKQVWSYTIYGTSTDTKNNGYEGNLNEDGKVTVFSENGKGKLESGAVDGIMFYYTAVPANKNFTLRAKMHLDKWTFSNGQEAIGLLASDSVPEIGTPTYWTNNYYLTLGTVVYNWDSEMGEVVYDGTGNKYDMRFGLGVYPNLGVTKENQDKIAALGLAATVDPNIQYPLELSAADKELPAGRYNIAGNVTNSDKAPTTIAELVDFDLEIQKNNTGYFFTYYDANGNVVGKQKFYDTDALCKVDEDNVYVGFFAARNVRATFSDVTFTTIDPEDDAPAEERPITYVTPAANITSSAVSNSPDYTLMFTPTVNGTATIYANGNVVTFDQSVTANEMFSIGVDLFVGHNTIRVELTPLPDNQQGFDEYTKLEHTNTVASEIGVTYNTNYASQNNLYVSPNGSSSGNGGQEYPLDIYTAVNVVQPGQNIVVMEGTYSLMSTVRIERGINGTADKPIKMIADPEAKSRPVFDFNHTGSGIRHGGDYWYFSGFDITGAADKSSGFRVCGNNNTVDQVNIYNNGGTGLQISAFRDSNDPKELWPKNNLILNCTSYNNADNGYEDADGFAAKLTVGEGNVFDGCASYNNADDGWDLFARASSGRISPVTIRNCIAYKNGVLLDGTKAGNGNGFKLGGGNLAGGHILINSIAFDNMADGITSNSCPDVQVINCTSYNNGKSNLNLYTNDKNNTTNFKVENLISCGGTGDSIKKNSTDTSQINEESNKVVAADAFVSTEFGGVKRKENGTLDLGDFLKLKDAAGGADLDKEGGSTPSEGGTTIVPDENLPTPPSDPVGTVTSPTTPSKDKDVEFNDSNSDTDIKVTAPADAFDKSDEIKFNADPVVEETKDNLFTFELSFIDKDGNKVQPKVAVTVRIPVPEALKGKTVFVYHVEDDGKYTEIDCTIENGMVVFKASKFSKYIITSEKLTNDTQKPEDNSKPESDSNSDTASGTTSDPGTSTNPSTGVPAAGLPIVFACAAAICILKRKRG